MKHLKHFLLMAAMLLCSVGASAETVEIDGIWYNLISKAKQAEVTSSGGTKYSGSITLPATVTYDGVAYSVTSIGSSAFNGCRSLTTITIPEGVTSIGSRAFLNCTSLTAINIPEGVTSIGDYAFSGCNGLTSITIPEGVTSIGSYAFKGCRSLTTITLPESVTSIGDWAFDGCTSLTTITIPENSQLTSIGKEAFGGCSSLTSITIPEGVTNIGERAFYDCTSLTAINIPEGVTSIGDYAFSGCNGLTSITIPEGVTSIGSYAFKGCRSLTTITLPESVTSIGDWAFDGCTSLTAINIPEGVTSIGDEAFCRCSGLTVITIPEGVTSIGDGAFYDCSSLTSITIPGSVTSIGYSAFSYCPELTDVYCYAEKVPSTETNAFNGSYIEYATLHVPASAVNEYKNTAPWSGFGKFETTSIAVASITLSASSAALAEGESLTLTATVSPDDAEDKSISWSSSAPNVATVDNAGKVTAIVPGTAIITATANDGSGVSASCEVTVTPACYIITFLVDGEVYATETLSRGATISVPDAPTKKGHTFSGWSGLPETMPAKDITVSATFTVNKYQVTFKIDGVVIATYTQDYGSAIVAPEAPEREGYTFSGWGDVAETVPASDVTYEGSYSVNSYTVTYLVDGEVVHSESVNYGAAIVAPEEPTKEGHTFSGWSGLPETMPAKDITVSATFTVNKYQVTFKIDGVVIATYTQDYGSAIVAPEAPEREGYTFSGWGDVAETVPASDVTYEGSYSVNSYTVTYLVDGEVVHSESVNYGAAIVAPEEPTKEGHTFSGWSGLPETMPAKDITVSATFTVNKYQVTFKIDGVVIATYTQDYGSAIVAPEAPEREGYTFSGWGNVAETVPANDVTYEGSYSANLYNVYYFVGATLVHSVKVAYGEPIPEYIYEPEEEGYTFLGWIGESYATMPAHDVTYTANIDNGIGTLTIDYSQLNIYDLTGRKVADTENLKGGIYIINGKKVVIK